MTEKEIEIELLKTNIKRTQMKIELIDCALQKRTTKEKLDIILLDIKEKELDNLTNIKHKLQMNK